MSDLIERLRTDLVPHDVEALVEEAADALEAKDKEIERLTADCEMKDKRIDWTVSDNVKKALEIEALRAALKGVDAYPNTLRDLEDDK